MLTLSMISSLFLEMSAVMKTGHLQEATQFTRSLRFSSRPAPHGCWVTVNPEQSQQHYMLIKIIPASFYTCTCTHDTQTHTHTCIKEAGACDVATDAISTHSFHVGRMLRLIQGPLDEKVSGRVLSECKISIITPHAPAEPVQTTQTVSLKPLTALILPLSQ